MNFRKITGLLALVIVAFSGCKKDNGSVSPITHLVVSEIIPATPTVDHAFTVTVEAKDANGQNQSMTGNTTITLSLESGNGTLSGDLTAVMQGPDNIIRFTNVKYDKVESNVKIKATCTAGNHYTPGISGFFTVTGPMLIFKFKFDSTQVRLNNIGLPSTIPAGNAAQSPRFNSMSAHYIELAPNDLTPVGGGEILYKAPEVADTTYAPQWTTAIDFSQCVKAGNGGTFFSIPLKNITPGTYKWLRVSLAYQNFDINYRVSIPPVYPTYDGTGTIASFIGYNSYITSYTIKTQSMVVDGAKLQGYWGFETNITGYGPYITSGQSPANSTTVVNPNPSSPIPTGSCLVTAQFADTTLANTFFNVTGTEQSDIVVIVSVSTNKSFEWVDSAPNNIFEPQTEAVVDMGVRGIIPIIQ
jgi:hypothetical protein